MRSSSRYCFSFLSCSVAPAGKPGPPAVPAAPSWEPERVVHWLMEDTEEEEEEEGGWDRLLWEPCDRKAGQQLRARSDANAPPHLDAVQLLR